MRPSFVLPALLLAAGCVHDRSSYPSLAPRATERLGFEEPTVTSPSSAADPALDAQVGSLARRLDAAVRAFDTDAAAAEKAATANGARTVGDDGWIAAQQALGTLDGRREEVTALANEVDALVQTRTETVGAPYPALDTLAARAQTEGERETARIAELTAMVPQP